MKIRRLVYCIAFILLVLVDRPGHSSRPKPTKIIEIFTDNSGFYFPAGKLLYVTIFSDRRLDYMERSDTKMVVRHRHLTPEQMKRLRILLDAKGVIDSNGLILAKEQPTHMDYQTNLIVSMQREDHFQYFTLRGFEPDAGRIFPQGFAELICFIDDIRNASYRVSSGCK